MLFFCYFDTSKTPVFRRMDAPKSVSPLCRLNKAANTAVIANAIRQALWPAIFSTLSAIISHKMGSIAKKNFKNNDTAPPLHTP